MLFTRTIPPKDIPFESFFYFEILMILVLTLFFVKMREIEGFLLIEIGIFKHIDDMTDVEMFKIYEKLRKESY